MASPAGFMTATPTAGTPQPLTGFSALSATLPRNGAGAGGAAGGRRSSTAKPQHSGYLLYGSVVSIATATRSKAPGQAARSTTSPHPSSQQLAFLSGKGFSDVGVFLVHDDAKHDASFRNCVFQVYPQQEHTAAISLAKFYRTKR